MSRRPSPARRMREPPSLTQFVVLSMLVHLLVIVLFRQPLGVPGGRGEQGLLSTLEIVLAPSRAERAAEPSAPSLWRRWLTAPSRERRESRREPIAPSSAPQAAPPAQPDIAPPSSPPANESLPTIDRSAPDESEKPLARPAERAPLALPQQPLAPFEIEPPRAFERELPPPSPIAPAPPLPEQPLPAVSAPAVKPLERAMPPAPELPAPAALPREPLPRIEAPAARAIERELPRAPELPPAAALPSQALPRVETPATHAIEREPPVAPDLPAAAALPSQPLPHVATPATRAIERELPRAPELPGAAALPSQPLPHVATPATRAIERELPVAPELPAAAALPSQPMARVDMPAARALAPSPSLVPAPAGVADGAPPSRLYAPVVPLIEPKPAEDAAPHFDFQRARDVARDFNRGRVVGRPVDFEPAPAERSTQLGRAIQKAAQPDCREAYAALGLLGIIPLLADTVLDRGCRW